MLTFLVRENALVILLLGVNVFIAKTDHIVTIVRKDAQVAE